MLFQSTTNTTGDLQFLKKQLADAFTDFCRSVLAFESELSIEGLIGITLDKREIFLVNINETLTSPSDNNDSIDTNLFLDLPDEFVCNSTIAARPSLQKRKRGCPKKGLHATSSRSKGTCKIRKRKRLATESVTQTQNMPASGNCRSEDHSMHDLGSSTARETTAITPEDSASNQIHSSLKLEFADCCLRQFGSCYRYTTPAL